MIYNQKVVRAVSYFVKKILDLRIIYRAVLDPGCSDRQMDDAKEDGGIKKGGEQSWDMVKGQEA